MAEIKRTLEEQRIEFKQRKLLATPISGLIAWLIVALSGLFFSPVVSVWVLFIATGSIVYIALGVSKITGEDFLAKDRPKNSFDKLFFYTVAQAVLVYSIAIPFFLIDYTSLPLTVGILTGLMWVPMTWIIEHWVGLFHSILRTVTVLVLWYLFPDNRFITIPLAIVFIYILTILILQNRKIDN